MRNLGKNREMILQYQQRIDNGDVREFIDAICEIPDELFTFDLFSDLAKAYVGKSVTEPSYPEDERMLLEMALEELMEKQEQLKGEHRWNYRVGVVNLKLGFLSKAQVFLKTALELKPGDSRTLYALDKCIDVMSLPADRVYEPYRDRCLEPWSELDFAPKHAIYNKECYFEFDEPVQLTSYLGEISGGYHLIPDLFEEGSPENHIEMVADYFTSLGIIPMSFIFSKDDFEDLEELESFQRDLLDTIKEISGEDSFETIGSCYGPSEDIIDILAYDYPAVMEAAMEFLEEYSDIDVVSRTHYKDARPLVLTKYSLNAFTDLFLREESSSVGAILPSDGGLNLEDIHFERINNLEGCELIYNDFDVCEGAGCLIFTYEGEGFRCYYELMDVFYGNTNPEYFREFFKEELEEVKACKQRLTIHMNFENKPLERFHMQIKLLNAIIPDLVAVVDHSAEIAYYKDWVKLCVSSKVTPIPTDIFKIRMSSDDNKKYWLYTAGLQRAGITDLEILDVDEEYLGDMYELILNLGTRLVDEIYLDKDARSEGAFEYDFGTVYHIGMFENNTPVLATPVLWTKGIETYEDKDILGLLKDRRTKCNSNTSLVMIAKLDETYDGFSLFTPMELIDSFGEYPFYFISDLTYSRMKALAIERIDYLEKGVELAKYIDLDKIVAIAKLKIDNIEGGSEHLWFDVTDIDEARISGILTHDPYGNCGIKRGDIGVYPIDRVTDWKILTPDFVITPSTAYLLDIYLD